MPQGEYSQLSEFEQKIYQSKGVFVIKQPNFFEKLSCGSYMATNAFKIFDEKCFAKGAVKFLNDFRLSSYENDHLMDIREVSDCL
jgi:hypothetical protein